MKQRRHKTLLVYDCGHVRDYRAYPNEPDLSPGRVKWLRDLAAQLPCPACMRSEVSY